MHKIMALDIGTKRIGVALSDFLHVIATGLCVVDRIPEDIAVEKIKKIASENRVEKIIVGVPFNMDGTQGSQVEDCLKFAKNFQQDFEVIFEDERLTSEQAEENLKERKINFKKDKGLVDIESACIILEQYLNNGSAGIR
jgi:putative Holliday junction resolvase